MPSFQADDQTVISVDTKKKELVGCKRDSGALRTAGVGRSTLYRVLKLMDDSVMVASGAA
jgi:hypothetical protein